MTVGDPKKAMVLSVIAVIIVCVAVVRSIPSRPSTPSGQGATLLGQAGSEPKKEPQPEEVKAATIDAFSHPNLGRTAAQVKVPSEEAGSSASSQRPPTKRTDGMRRPSGEVPPFQPNPAGITGNDQQTQVGEPVITVRLDAIVRGETAMAALSVAGKSISPRTEGMTLDGYIQLIRIKETSVVIQVLKRTYEIAVGQEVTL